MALTTETALRRTEPVYVDTAKLAVITVTFHPDLEKLARQLSMLPADAALVLVDNASTDTEVEGLKRLIAGRARTSLLENADNLGLAAAINQGATFVAASEPACSFLLLLDQDSEPRPESIETLLQALLQLEKEDYRVGCVGPRLVDEATGLQHGFHRIRGWRWTRVFPSAEDMKPIVCANLNGSGTVVRTTLFQQLGGLDETLFIDHVDTEWSFRVLARGYALIGIPQAIFDHSMGECGLRFWWFGWRVWPQRTPVRHYYLFRNAVRLLARDYVPRVWKFWAMVKLGMTMLTHAIFDHQRSMQLRNMWRGIRDGIRSARGSHENTQV